MAPHLTYITTGGGQVSAMNYLNLCGIAGMFGIPRCVSPALKTWTWLGADIEANLVIS